MLGGVKLMMKINEFTCISGRKIVLTPYKEHHVQRYHEWMKSEELQRLTASEPLSLEEEYEMQTKWHQDENKLTFIIMNKERWNDKTVLEEDAMCGDVNLFLNNPDDPSEAEIEIMIAELDHREKGIGTEALYLMMSYGVKHLQLKKFTAKIGLDNYKSLSLFRNKLGFAEVSRSEVFQEMTLELAVTREVRNSLQEQSSHSSSSIYIPKVTT